MSYCRWSSNDFQCDVYVYEHVGGYWVIHIAENRTVFKDPIPPKIDPVKDVNGWIKREKLVTEMSHRSKREKIGLPYDGETFYESNQLDTANRLKELKKIGYMVPDYAIEELENEAKEIELQNKTKPSNKKEQ